MKSWFEKLSLVVLLSVFVSANGLAKELIPYVGCPGSDGSDGSDGGGIESGTPGGPVSVDLDHASANLVAFYAGPYGPKLSSGGSGLIAPRGWKCFWQESTDGNYGMLVAPTEKDLIAYENYDNAGTSSAAISYDFWDGGTAGRETVIPFEIRYFLQSSTGGNKETVTDAEAEAIASGQIAKSDVIPTYPDDAISYKSRDILEFMTPAGMDGLGTRPLPWGVRKSNLPIYGILRVDQTGDTDAELFKVKLPNNLSHLRQVILDDFENNMKKEDTP
jgi:hypothetical protein